MKVKIHIIQHEYFLPIYARFALDQDNPRFGLEHGSWREVEADEWDNINRIQKEYEELQKKLDKLL